MRDFDQFANPDSAHRRRRMHSRKTARRPRANPRQTVLAGRRSGRPLATASIMLCACRATFLAAEVLAASVHRNILCPEGAGCCT